MPPRDAKIAASATLTAVGLDATIAVDADALASRYTEYVTADDDEPTPIDADANALTTLTALTVSAKPIELLSAKLLIVTALADADTPNDAEAAPCVVSGTPNAPEPNVPEPYVERSAISSRLYQSRLRERGKRRRH